MHIDDNKDLFLSKGLKNTKSRNLIYDLLQAADFPLTAEQIFIKLKEIDAAINLSTIYRTLELFVEKSLVTKAVMAEDNKAVFALNQPDHKHYLVCLNCKQMIPVEGCPLEEYEKLLHNQMGFDITGHKFEIYGYCQKCQRTRNNTTN